MGWRWAPGQQGVGRQSSLSDFVGRMRLTASWAVGRAGIRSERGAAAVEYGILVAMIAAVVIVAVVFLGKKTSESFSCTASNVGAGSAGTGC
jgi:pilus assembly protein Flp/PilA